MSLFLQIMCDNEFQELTHLRETQQFAGKHCSWCVRWVDKSRLSGQVVDLWVAGAFHLLLSHLEPRSPGARHQDNCASRRAALATSWRAERVTLLATAPAPHALLLELAGGWLPGGLAQRFPPGSTTMTAHLSSTPFLCGGTPVLTLVSGSPFPTE